MKTIEEYLAMSIKALQKEKNWRDLGKAFATANEHFQADMINEICSFDVEVRDDFDTDPDTIKPPTPTSVPKTSNKISPQPQ